MEIQKLHSEKVVEAFIMYKLYSELEPENPDLFSKVAFVSSDFTTTRADVLLPR